MMHAYTFASSKDTGDIALQMTLYVIAMHVNVETGKTFVSIKTLMDEAKIKSDRTMRTYLKDLEDLGFIKREKRARSDGGNTSDNIELVGFLEWFRALRGKKGTPPVKSTGAPGNLLTGPPGSIVTGHEQLSNSQLTKKRTLRSFERMDETSVRDTDESFAAYTERMIREGKFKPNGASK